MMRDRRFGAGVAFFLAFGLLVAPAAGQSASGPGLRIIAADFAEFRGDPDRVEGLKQHVAGLPGAKATVILDLGGNASPKLVEDLESFNAFVDKQAAARGPTRVPSTLRLRTGVISALGILPVQAKRPQANGLTQRDLRVEVLVAASALQLGTFRRPRGAIHEVDFSDACAAEIYENAAVIDHSALDFSVTFASPDGAAAPPSALREIEAALGLGDFDPSGSGRLVGQTAFGCLGPTPYQRPAAWGGATCETRQITPATSAALRCDEPMPWAMQVFAQASPAPGSIATPSTQAAPAQAPQAQVPQAQAPQAPGPQAQGPQAQDPQAQGPQAQDPQAPGPQAQDPQAPGPQAQGPQAQGPQAQGPQAQGPQAQGPQAQDPQASGPSVDPEQQRPSAPPAAPIVTAPEPPRPTGPSAPQIARHGFHGSVVTRSGPASGGPGEISLQGAFVQAQVSLMYARDIAAARRGDFAAAIAASRGRVALGRGGGLAAFYLRIAPRVGDCETRRTISGSVSANGVDANGARAERLIRFDLTLDGCPGLEPAFVPLIDLEL